MNASPREPIFKLMGLLEGMCGTPPMQVRGKASKTSSAMEVTL